MQLKLKQVLLFSLPFIFLGIYVATSALIKPMKISTGFRFIEINKSMIFEEPTLSIIFFLIIVAFYFILGFMAGFFFNNILFRSGKKLNKLNLVLSTAIVLTLIFQSRIRYLSGNFYLFIIFLLIFFGLTLIFFKKLCFILGFKKMIYGILIVSFLILIINLLIYFPYNKTQKETVNYQINPNSNKVLLIALDGADWKIAKPMIEKGELPTMESFIHNGVYANTVPIKSAKSPTAWTSIFTSKQPEDHMITDFLTTTLFNTYQLPGMLFYPEGVLANKIMSKIFQKTKISNTSPMTSNLRRSKTIWEILSENGQDSLIVGHWVSWPAEKFKGRIATDYVWPANTQLDSGNLNAQKGDSGELNFFDKLTYPENLYYQIQEEILLNSDISDEEIDKMNLKKNKMWHYTKDKTFIAITKKLLTQKQPSFASVYLEGADVSVTYYWKYHPLAGDMQEEDQKYSETIETYYKYIDKEIGNILEIVDDDTIVIIISENGNEFDGTDERSLPQGIFLMKGSMIKRGDIGNIKSVDVMPTILYLLGHPIAEDLEGDVLIDAINKKYLDLFPIEYIPSYGSKTPSKFDIAPVSKDDFKLQLKSLGYIT